MTFSQYAGIAIVPTLSRIVLCAAFLSAGWNKVWKDADYTHENAEQLKALGVDVSLKPETNAETPSASRGVGQGQAIVPASYRQDAPTGSLRDQAKETADEAADEVKEAAKEVSDAVANPNPGTAGVVPPPSLPPGTYLQRGLYHVALLLDSKGWQYPVLLAWVAGLTEFFGGALLLVGLFSRVWGLGLAIAMGVAFYLVGLPMIQEVGLFSLAATPDKFGTVFSQLGLFVLAFGILLTGPGPLSLDRAIFRRNRSEELMDDKIDLNLPKAT